MTPPTAEPITTDAEARRYLRRLDTIVPGLLRALYEHHRGRGEDGKGALEMVVRAHAVAVESVKGGRL